MKNDQSLRRHLLYLLQGGGAHLGFDQAVAGVPFALWGKRPRGAPHTLWQLVEHLRIAQWDILEFSRNPKHVSPKFPQGYWPKTAEPPTRAALAKSLRAFRRDLKAMQKLVAASSTDLYARIPHGDGQTVLREALLIADHNAYHLGQIVLLRRLLGVWREPSPFAL